MYKTDSIDDLKNYISINQQIISEYEKKNRTTCRTKSDISESNS